MNFRECVLVLFVSNVFCDEIVRYNFEENFDLNFFNNEAPCTGMPLWNLGNYTSIDIERPNELSERYIKPLINLSCVSSFKFSMSVGGTLEVNLYMDSANFVITDLVTVLAEQIRDGNNANVGSAFYSSQSLNFAPGWQTLSFQVFGSLLETFDGRIVLMGMADPNSTVLVDSFCYKPPNFDGDCWASDSLTIPDSITPTHSFESTSQTIVELEPTTPTLENKEGTTIQLLVTEAESTPESYTEPTIFTAATPTTDVVTDFTTVTVTEISTILVSKPTSELEMESTSLAETELATVTRIELTTKAGSEVTRETEVESTTRTETEPVSVSETGPTTLTIKYSTITTETDSTTLTETEPTFSALATVSETEPTTAVPTVTEPDSTSPTLENPCPEGQVHRLLPHEENCGLFYICDWGEKIMMVCPSGLHFNPKIQVCDWPLNAGCATN